MTINAAQKIESVGLHRDDVMLHHTKRIVIPPHTHATLHTPDPIAGSAESYTVIYEIGVHAHLNVTHEHIFSADGPATINYQCSIEQGGSLTYTMLVTGGQQTAITLEITLRGEHASASVRGMVVLAGQEHARVTTMQHHMARNTSSDLLIHAAVADEAGLNYQGSVTIAPEAIHTVASQRATILLLGDKARATAMPSLQVHTNEVRCTHGSALGRLDHEQVQYLCSRGMSVTLAKRLLLEGFFGDIVRTISSDLRDSWMSRIIARLSL